MHLRMYGMIHVYIMLCTDKSEVMVPTVNGCVFVCMYVRYTHV